MKNKRRIIGLSSAAAVAVAGLTVGAVTASASGPPVFPLDDVPGLGQGPEAAGRDDVIAYWEAYRRASVISECMEAAGFEYVAEVQFPEGAVLDVAATLGQEAAPEAGKDPGDINRNYEHSLSAQERDRYLKTLYDESAADIDRMRETGRVPAEHAGPFAEGGCVGNADEQVGTVWGVRRSLAAPRLALLDEARASDAFASHARQYVECVHAATGVEVEGPGDLEEHLTADYDAQLDAAATRCDKHWTEANRAGLEAVADGFRGEHRQAIEAQQNRYRGVMARIRADEPFLAYLRAAAGRIKSAMQEDD